VAVPEVHVDEAGAEIEDAPVARVQPRPLRAGDDHVLEAGLRRPRDEDVIGGVLRDRRWIGGALRRDGHRAESSRENAWPPGSPAVDAIASSFVASRGPLLVGFF